MEKLEEYKAQPIPGLNNNVYNGADLKMEEIVNKINEIVDFINAKKDQLL